MDKQELIEQVIDFQKAKQDKGFQNFKDFADSLLEIGKQMQPNNPYDYVAYMLETMSNWNKKDWERIFGRELSFKEIRDAQVIFEKMAQKTKAVADSYAKVMSKNEQLAYHGTTKKFDKFDISKFERGDYGYGIYFTTDKSYASNYGDVKQFDVPDSEYLLNWENSYDTQSEYIIDCLDKMFDDLYEIDEELYDRMMELINKYNIDSGGAIYNHLGEKLTGKQIADLMYSHGIKGIESLSGNCIVVFNPQDVKNEFAELNEQLEKYLEDS